MTNDFHLPSNEAAPCFCWLFSPGTLGPKNDENVNTLFHSAIFQTDAPTRPAMQESRPSEAPKTSKTTSSSGRSKDSGSESSGLGQLAQLARFKTKGDPNVDAKTLANAVAAATAASATSVESRRSLKKGELKKCVQASA